MLLNTILVGIRDCFCLIITIIKNLSIGQFELVSNIAFNSIPKAAPVGSANVADNNESDTMIHSRFADILDSAIAAPEIDQEAIAQAAAMAKNGTLDIPENTISAAQNILTYGI